MKYQCHNRDRLCTHQTVAIALAPLEFVWQWIHHFLATHQIHWNPIGIVPEVERNILWSLFKFYWLNLKNTHNRFVCRQWWIVVYEQPYLVVFEEDSMIFTCENIHVQCTHFIDNKSLDGMNWCISKSRSFSQYTNKPRLNVLSRQCKGYFCIVA